jgi:hypothetical protein
VDKTNRSSTKNAPLQRENGYAFQIIVPRYQSILQLTFTRFIIRPGRIIGHPKEGKRNVRKTPKSHKYKTNYSDIIITMKRVIRKSSSKNNASSLLPVWNKPLLEPTVPGSRDPLGFQRYATLFSDQLLPNITVLTGRARYFSYLAWVLDELQRYAEPLY